MLAAVLVPACACVIISITILPYKQVQGALIFFFRLFLREPRFFRPAFFLRDPLLFCQTFCSRLFLRLAFCLNSLFQTLRSSPAFFLCETLFFCDPCFLGTAFFLRPAFLLRDPALFRQTGFLGTALFFRDPALFRQTGFLGTALFRQTGFFPDPFLFLKDAIQDIRQIGIGKTDRQFEGAVVGNIFHGHQCFRSLQFQFRQQPHKVRLAILRLLVQDPFAVGNGSLKVFIFQEKTGTHQQGISAFRGLGLS